MGTLAVVAVILAVLVGIGWATSPKNKARRKERDTSGRVPEHQEAARDEGTDAYLFFRDKIERLGQPVQSTTRDEAWAVKSKQKLLTPTETIFYERLKEALPECTVFAQVAVNQLLTVTTTENTYSTFNKFTQLSVDFLVCLPDTTVVAAIELDDPSHQKWKRKKADSRKDQALKSGGITLLRWDCRNMPTVAEIRAAFTH